jgi:GNAT superfamily N-acetyltransferase
MASDNITIRRAEPGDCDIILHHRRSMFQHMNEGTAEELDRTVQIARPWLITALSNGNYQGWLAENGEGEVVAGAGVVILSWPASPKNPENRRALIVNVFTEPEFRGQGLARRLMLTVLGWLKEQGFHMAALHASDAGKHLYEKLGFRASNEMQIRLE